MMIAERRLSGSSPLRPGLGPEFALAVIWAEGALARARSEDREAIERFLSKVRLEHNNNWRSPAGREYQVSDGAEHNLQVSTGTIQTRSIL